MNGEQEKLLLQSGFCVLRSVFESDEIDQLVRKIDRSNEDGDGALRSRGTVFAARNLIDSIPDLIADVGKPRLKDCLATILGSNYGLVRALYFDKPSDRSWQLPFHKDLTIAVADNSLPTSHFSKPTHKAGVDHVEASTEILESMLTLRIHLDEVTLRNGPLQVVPGSHLTGKKSGAIENQSETITAKPGDVLVMRPLISHASGHTEPGSSLRRRILHLEFCGVERLPDGYRWMHFLRL